MAILKNPSVDDIVSSSILLWSALLILVCLLGDVLCSFASQSLLLWRAVADNMIHGAVGVVAWAVVVMPGFSVDKWGQCLLCGLLASVIDLDHFWQAGSFQLQDAVSLQQRPLFHSTSLVLVLSALLWVVSLVFRLYILRKVTCMCAVAWLSHHLRDASRRGLWFPPLGSTPPLPYAVYIGGTVVLSVLMHYGYSGYYQAPSAQERILEVVPKVVVQ
ncbi:transmembrane protein 267-like [Babylonia areolata]|uniref:transmembrane protein 267-like n=1 Tax=Babylonia areolata TaxID=304850 RepID=UPI003FD3DBD4